MHRRRRSSGKPCIARYQRRYASSSPVNGEQVERQNKVVSKRNNKRVSKLAYLAAKSTGILRVLGNFDLLHHLTKGSSITGAVLADDADLLGTLGL